MIAPDVAIVHIVEDDEQISRALRRLIEAVGHRVATHASAEAFLAAWEPRERGCAIIDLALPGLDGLRLQARMEAEAAGFPILFLSGTGDINKSVAAMKGGAVDFLTKPVEEERLLDSIAAALDRGATVHEDRLAALRFAENLARLTPREVEVLNCIVEGLLNKQIADRLGMSESTVKIHRGRVMHKLEARTAAELASLVVGRRGGRI
jgi:FixJ family two-component response regulator